MIKKYLITVFSVISLSLAGFSHADICYSVEGKVETKNVSAEDQVGTIKIVLFDQDDDVVFGFSGENPGLLIGKFDGGTVFAPTLSHTAIFRDGSKFQTAGDTVQIDFFNPRKFDDQGAPCSFNVIENITTLQGEGFFENVTSANVTAIGYIAACFENGVPDENENEFELSGELCID